ncbi:MAG: hypothetical protein H7Z38_00040 [Rubrivivax sp.]|nr:hypothetical protein [Pyrinomonadaceae bacterium]
MNLMRRLRKIEGVLARTSGVVKTSEAAALEAEGWRAWLKTLGPNTFTGEFADFHTEFWSWYWPVRRKLLRGEELTTEEMSALLIWFRGGGKSSHVEWCCIAEGALCGSGYIGYVSGTRSQAQDHVDAIRKRLESEEVARYYPGLANPMTGKYGQKSGWRQDYLVTASGWGIIPIGLEEGIRGGRQFDQRFTMFVFDDIDSFEDTPAAIEKKENIIARNILPAGTPRTLNLFPQNLIHENSVMNRVYTRRSDVLAERKVFGPYPAFGELDIELDESGGRKWTIRRASPTWPHIDMAAAKKFLADSGRKAFLAEYQHDFEADRSERVLKNWRDDVHVITESEFEKVFGERRPPDSWQKHVANDFARTKSAYHANVVGKVTVSKQGSRLPGVFFLFDCMSFGAGTEADDVALRILESIMPKVMTNGGRRTWREVIEAGLTRVGLETYVADATKLRDARQAALSRVLPQLVAPILSAKKYVKFRGSHEQENAALKVYRQVFGLPFHPINPKKEGGLDMLNHLMHVDETKPHPFRAGEMGFTRFFMVVPDESVAYPTDVRPDALHDSDLARYQLRNWRFAPLKVSETGAVERGPMKMNDDFGNLLQFIFCENPPSAAPLTKDEQFFAGLPEKLHPEAIAQVEDPIERGRRLQAQLMHRMAAENKPERPRRKPDGLAALRNLRKSGR